MTWLAKDEGYVQTEEAEDSVDGKDTNRVATGSVFGGFGGERKEMPKRLHFSVALHTGE